jgi:hypothetical protein
MQVDKRIKEEEQNSVVIGRQIPDTQRMGQMKGESTSRDSIVTSCRSRETSALISNYRENIRQFSVQHGRLWSPIGNLVGVQVRSRKLIGLGTINRGPKLSQTRARSAGRSESSNTV